MANDRDLGLSRSRLFRLCFSAFTLRCGLDRLVSRRNSFSLGDYVQHGFQQPFLDFFARVTGEDAAACGKALQSAGRVIVHDVATSEVFSGQPSREVLLTAGVRAVQSTPLISSRGVVLGMISTHFPQPHTPSDHELRLIDLLARQAADYIERSHFERLLRAHSEAIEALNREHALEFKTALTNSDWVL